MCLQLSWVLINRGVGEITVDNTTHLTVMSLVLAFNAQTAICLLSAKISNLTTVS